MSRHSVRHHVEHRIQKQRIAEQRHADLRQKLKEQNIAATQGLHEIRVEGLRRQREEAIERKEILTDYAYVKAEQDKERKQIIFNVEDSLAAELERRRTTDAREEVNRRRICDGSEELRALKNRLNAASVNKERAMQLIDRQVREEEDHHREAQIATALENRRLEDLELEAKLEKVKAQARQNVKHLNLQQMAARDAYIKEEAAKEYERDRADVDDIVKRIHEEDEMEAYARRAQQEQARNMYRQTMEERRAQWAEMERRESYENARIADFSKQKQEFEDRLAQEKHEQEMQRQRILRSMLDEQLAQKRRSEDFDRVRQEFHEEELKEADRRREEARTRKKLEDRVEQQQWYEEHQRDVEVRRQRQAEDEQKFREQLLAKFAEDDRIEQMNAQKRRLKVQEHKREVERLIQLRREEYEAARQQERAEFLRSKEDEEQRQRVVEEERRRLLAEAAPLRQFFPKGVLEQEADIEIVGMTPSNAGGPSSSRAVSSGRAASVGRPPSLRQLSGQLPGNAVLGHASNFGQVAGRPFPLRFGNQGHVGQGRASSVGRPKAWATPPSSPEPAGFREDAMGFRARRTPIPTSIIG